MGLEALLINCTLKKSPEVSNTEVLLNKAIKLFSEKNVATETVRPVDSNILPGVSSNEGAGDEWPPILAKIKGFRLPHLVRRPVIRHSKSARKA